MKTRVFFSVLVSAIVMAFASLVLATDPTTSINFKGSPVIVVNQGDSIEGVTVSIDPGDWSGREVQYWVLYKDPYGQESYLDTQDVFVWVRGNFPSYRGLAFRVYQVILPVPPNLTVTIGVHKFSLCISDGINQFCSAAAIAVKEETENAVLQIWENEQILVLQNSALIPIRTDIGNVESGGAFLKKCGSIENQPPVFKGENITVFYVKETCSNDMENWFFQLSDGSEAWLNIDQVSFGGIRAFKNQENLIEYGYYSQPVILFEKDGAGGVTASLYFGDKQPCGFLKKIGANQVSALRWNSFANWEINYRGTIQTDWLGNYFFKIHGLPSEDAGSFTLLPSDGSDPIWINLGGEWKFQAGEGVVLSVDESTGTISYQ